MATHHLDDQQPHAFWDNAHPPRVRIKPGDTVVFETQEASANQVRPDSAHETVAHLDFGLIHPLTGPVYVEGAELGDGLEVEVVRIKHKGWGWNASSPVSACWRMIFRIHICIITSWGARSVSSARIS